MQINWVTTRRRQRRCHCQFERSRVNFESDKQDGWRGGRRRAAACKAFSNFTLRCIFYIKQTPTHVMIAICYICILYSTSFPAVVSALQLNSRQIKKRNGAKRRENSARNRKWQRQKTLTKKGNRFFVSFPSPLSLLSCRFCSYEKSIN